MAIDRNSGTFIVLDGPDASGTSTQCKFLVDRLIREGFDVLSTNEPTNGPVGGQIREFLKTGQADPLELQMLFTSDRAWHVKNVIEPALLEGKVIVCDRYSPSTLIYAEAQGIPTEKLKELNNKFIQPDCLIFTLPPLSVSLRRLAKRSEKEVFEQDDLQSKIYNGYSRMAAEDPEIIVIDTSGEKQDSAEKIWNAVSATIKP